jgi:hypothetical protein
LIPALSADCAVDNDAIAWPCPLTVLDSNVDTETTLFCRAKAAAATLEESPASTV